MLKIRLTRRGKKNKVFFRLVVAENTAPVKGRFIEVLGFLDPHTKEKNLKVDRIKYWIGNGAQCSDTVHNLLVNEGVIEGKKRAVKMKKAEIVADNAEKAPAAASAEAGIDKAENKEKDVEKPAEESTKEAEKSEVEAESTQEAAPEKAE